MTVTGLRKIVGAVVLLISALAITYFKGDIPPNLTSFMEILYFTFVLGNGWEHFTKLKTNNNQKE